MDLAALQRWMLKAVTQSDSFAAQPVETVITSSATQSAAERLAVYQNAYFARLLECLAAEFPGVQAVLGEAAFESVVAAYLQRYPSSSYTLGKLGERFPHALQELRPARESETPDFFDGVIDLARYERLLTEVFDEAGPEVAPPSIAWPNAADPTALTVRFYPCVRTLALAYPVHEFVTARRSDEQAEFPAARRVALILSRRDYVVRRWEVPPWQTALIDALQQGLPLGAALEAVATTLPPPTDWDRQLQQAFATWAEWQLIAAVST
jgi:hypothetical protein